MIRELLAQAEAKEMAIAAFGGGRMVLAELGSVELDMGKRFLLTEEKAAVVCQLAMCAKGGDPLVFVKEGECSGLPGKTKSISIYSKSGSEYKHEPSCQHCRGLKKPHA